MTTQTFPRNPTDLLSFEAPSAEKPFQRVYDSMLTKHRYDRNVLNSNKWKDSTTKIPTMKTITGADYDIVSHKKMTPIATSIFTKKIVNHGKSIAEYNDFERKTHHRPNNDHREALSNDAGVFYKKDGIFTHLYNSAARLHVVKPFNY